MVRVQPGGLRICLARRAENKGTNANGLWVRGSQAGGEVGVSSAVGGTVCAGQRKGILYGLGEAGHSMTIARSAQSVPKRL